MGSILYRADVARILGIQPDTVTRYMKRYPKGHEFEFPQPDDPDSPFPYWDATRTDEIKAWRGPGRGAGGGRPRKDTNINPNGN